MCTQGETMMQEREGDVVWRLFILSDDWSTLQKGGGGHDLCTQGHKEGKRR